MRSTSQLPAAESFGLEFEDLTNIIHADSQSAWADLKARGGIEPDGRDEGFEEALRDRLAPTARSLADALAVATTDELVAGFFDLMQPFTAMYRAILDFFAKASVNDGRDQWNIRVGDVDIELEQFVRFLDQWAAVPAEIEVACPDYPGGWGVIHSGSQFPEVSNIYHGLPSSEPYTTGFADLDSWLSSYRSPEGTYEDWPASISPATLGPGYSDLAALGLAALTVIRKDYRSRTELVDGRRAHPFDHANVLAIGSLGQLETDFWLGTLVARLGRSLSLPAAVKADWGRRLEQAFAPYPLRKLGVNLQINELLKFLSMPVWGKRHELYSVWIATEIVNALPAHELVIHNENGRIVFGFHETLVATIKSANPVVQLISERWVKLGKPVGKGRTGGVQPDYGLWRVQPAGADSCGLVVEVKHYKRSAGSRFADVLTDYANGFPSAQVYLVSHGPISDILKHTPAELWPRTHTIANLTVAHRDGREQLRKAVADYVGEPSWALIQPPRGGPTGTVLAVDISASMTGLGGPDFLQLVAGLQTDDCKQAALIDVEVRAVVPVGELADALRRISGRQTSLAEPVQDLLRRFGRVVVITDDDGLLSLADLSHQVIPTSSPGFVVIEVRSDS